MQLRFLLGPAGSGKTYRCLAEIREALLQAPDGPPLVLLAPKQATFQLERQLLADTSLQGYTRLHILSFERLAEFVLDELRIPAPPSLSEEGRVMVLRALLIRHQSELKIFRASARLTGFAQQLSGVLREFQEHRLSPARLKQLAARPGTPSTLRDKLLDFSLLLTAYANWLKTQNLQDANHLLDAATETLGVKSGAWSLEFGISSLWLDGFAEMTPQELELLAAIIPYCEKATLAFCLDAPPREEPSWLSPWTGVAKTYRRCYERLEVIDDCQIATEILTNKPGHGRFADNELLRRLEANWSGRAGSSVTSAGQRAVDGAHGVTRPTQSSGVRVVQCADPESEAILAAREILQHIHAGGRYRDCAVIVRRLENCYATLARVFRRYEIPFFMDRREPVSHHPLTELTRFALRTIAFGWRHDDWFGALKTGLVPANEGEIDALENDALARGWEGRAWREPLSVACDDRGTDRCEALRRRLVPPFEKLGKKISTEPTGPQIADAIREFWTALKIEEVLEEWSEKSTIGNRQSAIHSTVFDQMSAWLDNLELAFATEAMPLREWLPVLEAGLVNLTVGVIPPALDQVLIGAIDRSRNPDLKLALVLGLNEGVFPAPPVPGTLLTEADRSALERAEAPLGPSHLQRLGQERFLGYIACTRPSERLVATCAARDGKGQPLNPSPFFNRIQEITGATVETFDGADAWRDSEHMSELAAPILRAVHERLAVVEVVDENGAHGVARPTLGAANPLLALAELPVFTPLVQKFRDLEAAASVNRLPTTIVEQLYGRELRTSVSRLEEFAACPFKFFTSTGLRVEERKEFQFDARDRGSFQHEILQEFHNRVHASKRLWRKLTEAEAVELIGAIGREQLPLYGGGRFLASGAARFTGEFLIERLQRLMAATIRWMEQYEFDPSVVEISFGLEEGGVPPWKFKLPGGRALELRGRIDRVDLYREKDGNALAVVMDYKSTARALNPTKLYHGLELQLLSYLGVLRHLSNPQKFLNIDRLVPAGVFYVPLNGAPGGSAATRTEALEGDASARQSAFQHNGRFLGSELRHFDNRGVSLGDQFKYSRKKDGSFGSRGNEAVSEADFIQLREKIESHLREYGMRIYSGEVKVSPFRINRDTACDRCEFRAICRFDSWTQAYRQLRPPPKEEK